MRKLIKRFSNILNESPEGKTIRSKAAKKRHTSGCFFPPDRCARPACYGGAVGDDFLWRAWSLTLHLCLSQLAVMTSSWIWSNGGFGSKGSAEVVAKLRRHMCLSPQGWECLAVTLARCLSVYQVHTDGACLQTSAVVVLNDELFIRSEVTSEI